MKTIVTKHDVLDEKWRTMNPRHCPVRLIAGDGVSVGACWHYLVEGVCPSHGRIYREAIRTISLADQADAAERQAADRRAAYLIAGVAIIVAAGVAIAGLMW
jgi:hypothetical protein